MHARRALFRRADAPAVGRFGRLLTVVWATCLVVGLLLMANFGYGMWKGYSDGQHLNKVWAYQAGAARPAAKATRPTFRAETGSRR